MARVAKENVRQKILEAAERRLWHYGLKKTTIDEIAADAGVGKGTVYLYFDSKEDISIAIILGYKQSILHEQEIVAADPNMETCDKIRRFLLLPLISAHNKCAQTPEVFDVIVALKPHLSEQMRPYLDKEIALLARLLLEGTIRGELDIHDSYTAARSLKLMTMGFYPPYPCVSGQEAIEHEIDKMVRLAVRGLRSSKVSEHKQTETNL
jgi:TetR/AcrR family transcriptional repressor of mexJK operon